MGKARTADQLEVLGALADVQTRLNERATADEVDLEWRSKLVASGRTHGLSVAEMAAHIDVKPSRLGQAAYRERKRLSATA